MARKSRKRKLRYEIRKYKKGGKEIQIYPEDQPIAWLDLEAAMKEQFRGSKKKNWCIFVLGPCSFVVASDNFDEEK